MSHYLWLIPLGFIVGAWGTLIGVGGGIVLIPVLLLLYPRENPEIITSISLAVVFVNALSGSVAYARMGRIDYKSGLMFSAATIPGAILGALSTSHIPRSLFDTVFGLLMIATSVFLFLNPSGGKAATGANRIDHLARSLVEKDGTVHAYSYNPLIGIGSSFFVGYVSSLLGIGGGIVHVPVMIELLHFPVHIATATSHFVLAIMSLTGTIVHVEMGSFSHGVRRTIALSLGVLPGAQLGALLSNRVKGNWIIRSLAIALGFVGIRILIMAW
ncbi:MAG: sulfite exporter TauE/SafE family protein [bacterium]